MTEANFKTIEQLDEFARKHDHSLTELAVGWLATPAGNIERDQRRDQSGTA